MSEAIVKPDLNVSQAGYAVKAMFINERSCW